MSLLLAILFAVLPACPTEDSDMCAWDAATQGDGTGTSFVSLFGTAYYLPAPAAPVQLPTL